MQAAHGSNRERIEALADRLEIELEDLGVYWSEVPDDERAAVIRRIGLHAPGIARLLCPHYLRFSALQSS